MEGQFVREDQLGFNVEELFLTQNHRGTRESFRVWWVGHFGVHQWRSLGDLPIAGPKPAHWGVIGGEGHLLTSR